VLVPANLVTFSGGPAAALLCGAAFSGRGLGAAWPGLMAGCTAADWTDGPLARRLGPPRLGGLLDLEADSWLTLWAAVAAYRQGGLGGVVLLAPILRYPLAAGRPGRLRLWQRAAGVTQMAVLCAALAPWPPARGVARSLAPLAAAFQLLALARGNDGPGARERVRIDDAHLADRLPLAHDRGGA
jgi:phosphatidylglycerophosphate synthase